MDEKNKYYGTVTELQEIRKAMKYLAVSVDNLVQKQQNVNAIAEQLTFNFNSTIKSVVSDAVEQAIEKHSNQYQKSKKELLEELKIYKREYNFARTQEERDKYRSLINSIMNELNGYY